MPGQSEWNAASLFTGWANVPLTTLGKNEAAYREPEPAAAAAPSPVPHPHPHRQLTRTRTLTLGGGGRGADVA